MAFAPISQPHLLSGDCHGLRLAKGDVVLPSQGNDKADAIDYGQDGCKQQITPPLWDANVLYAAFRASQKSAPWKPQTHLFEMDFLHQIALLQKELKTRTYRTSPKTEFLIRERGKTRLIQSSRIRDKVVRHAFCDHVLEPELRKKMVYDNYASLKDKGVHMCRNRLKVMLHRFYRQYGTNDGYILLMDYSGYYDNLQHDKVLDAVSKVIGDEYAQWLLRLVLDGFKQDVSWLPDEEIKALDVGRFKALDFIDIPKRLKTGEKFLRKSLDIGDQCSQILGVYYPTALDQYIKTVRGIKLYARYMDDSYVIAKDKQFLIDLLKDVGKITDAMGIILNDRKVRIVKLSQAFRFLQNSYFLTESGKIVERINPKRITVMRRKLKKLARKMHAGTANFEDINTMFRSWKGRHYRIMSRLQRRNMDNLYNSLFKEQFNEPL